MLLNPPGMQPLNADNITTDISIPLLDDPIDPGEVVHVIEKQLKPNKGCGPDGLSPGIFRLLTDPWLVVSLRITLCTINQLPIRFLYKQAYCCDANWSVSCGIW